MNTQKRQQTVLLITLTPRVIPITPLHGLIETIVQVLASFYNTPVSSRIIFSVMTERTFKEEQIMRNRAIFGILTPLLLICTFQYSRAQQLDGVQLREGFRISLFAGNIPNARSMTRGSDGTIFVGTLNRGGGRVFALRDENGDYRVDEVYTLAKGLNLPNGVAYRDGSLYVAEVNRVLEFPDIESRLTNPPVPRVVSDRFPSDRAHGWKFIRFGPDGKLYVPVGAPCNVCERSDPRYATITRMNPDGSNLEVYARGVRNTVGFDWHPVTKELWFTDNGRDWMGDDIPPDELNHAPEGGLHFGFPYLHGRDIRDPEYWKRRTRDDFRTPARELGPHVAALGMIFYTGTLFPEEYRNQIFIAEHGSWNRSVPIGYRITLVRLQGNRAISYEVFAEGWLEGERAWGRPVDLLQLPDGSLLVSDDRANAIYRISYTGN
jgi:glucose/arabinose dehydrogenase